MSENNNIYSKFIPFSILTLVVVLIGSIVTAFYPLVRDEMHPRLENQPVYSPLELAGRDIYQREGCSLCHTQVVRPLKTEVLRYGDYSKGGESYGERPFLWGSRRTGPDLARVGGKYPDEWHMQHFLDPQKFAPKSNMPKYYWFENTKVNADATRKHMKTLGIPYDEEDMKALSNATELEAMTAYMQVLGIAVEPFQMVTISEEDFEKNGNPASGNPDAVIRGKALYIADCAGCHGVNGEGNVGMPLQGYGAYMEESIAFITIANGLQGAMPGFANTMSRMQIGSIVEYLKTIEEE